MKEVDKEYFFKLFFLNSGVLFFSVDGLDNFTQESIGVAVCEKYKLSKCKTIIAFCNEYPDEDIIKLFSDLLDYYEKHCRNNNSYIDDENQEKYFQECKKIIQSYYDLNNINITVIKKN